MATNQSDAYLRRAMAGFDDPATFDEIAFATWQSQIDLADELLADIAASRTKRRYVAIEIDHIRSERARFVALIAAYRAQLES